MRNSFDAQLERLNEEIIRMGSLCERAISTSATAMLNGDIQMAKEVNPVDREIDQKEREIESICLKLLLQQQPVARDLRVISAALKMITDMERIGDQASDIAEITMYLGKLTGEEKYKIKEMADASIKMVTDSIEAYVKQDVELAKAVLLEDDIVDNCFIEVRNSLIDVIGKSPELANSALDLMMIAKYFERIGDHAQNIAEWVLFSIIGTHVSEKDVVIGEKSN